jgi:hypothetical protein
MRVGRSPTLLVLGVMVTFSQCIEVFPFVRSLVLVFGFSAKVLSTLSTDKMPKVKKPPTERITPELLSEILR